MSSPAAVIGFWFGPPPYEQRADWFRKSEAFDRLVAEHFGAEVEAALAGTLAQVWAAEPLAEILLLDQFTRNIFRGSARAFAGDARALLLAQQLVASGEHLELPPMQRWFAYLPFEHAEDLALQDESVRLFGALAAEDPGLAGALDYAQRHHEVIRRFGRFPHRNALLGRSDTAAEIEYLAQPGAGF
ncbi:hypothetical protein CLD22_29695 [Rubrivivax gelatinosus]|uniref:DUF924 family protein n=1 Tax=Rubrivivax gelatinosus TaxID=28068 RepID=UPI001906CFB9|nr:hypothetical protein [Rubrivivax gelatinosus]